MKNSDYYKQIVNSYLCNTVHFSASLCLSDNISDEKLGQCISAMANTAALNKIPYVYAFWGINESNKSIAGSHYLIPDHSGIANHLSTNVFFDMQVIEYNDTRVVVLEVQRSYGTTIQYDGKEFIILNKEVLPFEECSDNDKKKLWSILSPNNEEDFLLNIASYNVSERDVLKLLDWKTLFDMMQKKTTYSVLEVLTVLKDFRFITEQNTGKYNITNLGALLLAKRLADFESVVYKSVRVIIYSGNNHTKPAHEQIGYKGYIIGFEGLIKYICDHLPQIEYIDGSIRKYRTAFSMLTIRELVANAIIHQDLSIKGAPVVSIFDNYIDIYNPGVPIIDKERFLDTPSRSRNESLAYAMHRVGICEERGSGYDKVIDDIEKKNLLSPEIILHDGGVSVILRKEKDFHKLSKEELIRICYDHTCLNYIRGEKTNNNSLRNRLHLDYNKSYAISRIFKNTLEAGKILIKNGTGQKNREYIPYWAK